MSGAVYFLSWLRTGLATAIAASATDATVDQPQPSTVSLPIELAFTGSGAVADDATGTVTAQLHGPGEVLALDTAAVARTYPADGTVDAERSWFPYVEYSTPYLPWMFSTAAAQTDDPAPPGARRGLQPWLTLIVVPSAVATVTAAAGSSLPTVSVPIAELPDLSQAWLWTHAQVSTPDDATTVQTVLGRAASGAFARSICPRRLANNTAYLACLVPTTDAGSRAGLGEQPSDEATLEPAWIAGADGEVTLPAYYSWSFSTGSSGDVQALVNRLVPSTDAALGIRPMDIGAAGTGLPGPGAGEAAWIIDLEGSLISAATTPGDWPDTAVRTAIEEALHQRLDAGQDALRPPLYGGAQAGQATLSGNNGWLRTLNTDPRYRAAAAAGARLVLAEQESLIDSAWEQAGELSRAAALLRRGQLARAIGSVSYSATVGSPEAMDDAAVLAVTTPAHASITAATAGETISAIPAAGAAPESADPADPTPSSIAAALAVNPSAAAASSIGFRRLTHPTSALATRAGVPLTALARLANPDAVGGTTVLPPQSPATGTTTLTSLSPSTAPVALRELTAQVVSQPRLPWESGTTFATPQLAAASPRDGLLAAGYLSDVWVYPSTIGQLTDWDGAALNGWQPMTPSGSRDIGALTAGSSGGAQGTGGSVALYRWDAPDESPSPAITAAALRCTIDEEGPLNDWFCTITVTCELRGDLIPGVHDSPVQSTSQPDGPPTWPTHEVYSTHLSGAVEGDPPTPIPTVYMSSAITMADFDATTAATPIPSVALAYIVTISSEQSMTEVRQIALLRKVMPDAAVAETITAPLPPRVTGDDDTDLGSLAIAGGRLYLVIGRRLYVAPVSATAIGTWSEVPNWDAALPADWLGVSIAAADYTGDGYGDLVMVYTRPLPSAPGSEALQSGLRICYLSRSDGSLATWSDELEVRGPVGPDQHYLLTGGLTSSTNQIRDSVTAAFRSAAAAVQAEVAPRVPASPDSGVPVTVVISDLARQVRTTLDPVRTVPAAVNGQVILDGANLTGQPDPIADLLISPMFPQPLSSLQVSSGVAQVVPGLENLANNTVNILQNNPAVIEAFLVGANTEFSRQLRWRGFPAYLNGTYFTTYWNAAATPDITDVAGWSASSALGTHAPSARAVEDLTVVVIRGDLIRQLGELQVYCAPAVSTADGRRTIDLTTPISPLFIGALAADTRLFAFGFNVDTARGGSNDGLGRYLVFQEHSTVARFGFDESSADPPTDFSLPVAWRELTWPQVAGNAATYQVLRYADGGNPTLRPATLPLVDGQQPKHYWGFSAADMAHITARPPLLVAVHFSVYLPAPTS